MVLPTRTAPCHGPRPPTHHRPPPSGPTCFSSSVRFLALVAALALGACPHAQHPAQGLLGRRLLGILTKQHARAHISRHAACAHVQAAAAAAAAPSQQRHMDPSHPSSEYNHANDAAAAAARLMQAPRSAALALPCPPPHPVLKHVACGRHAAFLAPGSTPHAHKRSAESSDPHRRRSGRRASVAPAPRHTPSGGCGRPWPPPAPCCRPPRRPRRPRCWPLPGRAPAPDERVNGSAHRQARSSPGRAPTSAVIACLLCMAVVRRPVPFRANAPRRPLPPQPTSPGLNPPTCHPCPASTGSHLSPPPALSKTPPIPQQPPAACPASTHQPPPPTVLRRAHTPHPAPPPPHTHARARARPTHPPAWPACL